MTTTTPTQPPTPELNIARLEVSESAVRVCIDDARTDALALFAGLSPQQCETMARDIWTIGARVLGNAQSQAREARLEDIGRGLLDDVARHVRNQFDAQEKILTTSLARFFDPSEGEISKRLSDFVADEGVLGRFLRERLEAEHEAVATTLRESVGHDSPLLKQLDPEARDGLLCTLEARLAEVMATSQRALFQALDPMAEDGAVAKLLRSLQKELRSADEDRAALLGKAVAALDANDEASALSRLMRETKAARETLLQSLNPADPHSPMAAIRTSVQEMLDRQGETQRAFFEEHQQRYQDLANLVQEAIVRKQADTTAPRAGTTFEEAVVSFIEDVTRGGPYIVEATGSTTGLRARCKVGDAVISFSEDSAFAGCKVVVEAKRDASYTVAKALTEAKEARDNRGADVAVFVFASTHAPAGIADFERHGNTIVVTWDPEDGATDPVLRGALIAALAMSRRKKTGNEGDINALADIDNIITGELNRLTKMRAANDRISRSSDELRDELRKAERQFDRLLDKARDTLRALNVELADEDEEAATPVSLPTTLPVGRVESPHP